MKNVLREIIWVAVISLLLAGSHMYGMYRGAAMAIEEASKTTVGMYYECTKNLQECKENCPKDIHFVETKEEKE